MWEKIELRNDLAIENTSMMIISVPLRRKECLMIPHTENPKDYQKSIGLIKEFSKITGYKNKYTKIH